MHDKRLPLVLATCIYIGATCALVLHATLLPQYRRFDFSLLFYAGVCLLIFALAYAALLVCRRFLPPGRSGFTRPAGPGRPPDGAPVPAPVRPPTPALQAHATQAASPTDRPNAEFGKH
jgi:hypothetical protein